MKKTARGLALALTAATAVTACSTGPREDSQNGSAEDGEVQTGVGVTDDTISLVTLTDLSGPFGATGTPQANGQQVYYDMVNEDGGICDRQIEFGARDHKLDVQTAVTLYSQVEGEVLGISGLLGSAQTAALLEDIEADSMPAALLAFDSALLGSEPLLMPTTTYDLQMINGVDWLVEQGAVAEGDRIGFIYFEGPGENGLAGAEFAAEHYGLELTATAVRPTDPSVQPQITNLQNEDAAAVLLMTSPPQTASAASVAASQGYNVPIVSWGPGFAEGILGTAAGPAIQENVTVLAPQLPPSAENEVLQEFLTQFTETFPDQQLEQNVVQGYAVAALFTRALEAACEAGDLTREGVVEAIGNLGEVDIEVAPPLDFNDALPSRGIHPTRADATAEGGLVLIQDEAYVGEAAQEYELSGN